MKVCITQIYVQAGVSFPFSGRFQGLLQTELSMLLEPSKKYIEKYGSDFELTFYMSAKTDIEDNEIKGPTVFRKDKDVEYSIFLPFNVIAIERDVFRSASKYLFQGMYAVFEKYDIDTSKVREKEDSLIEAVCSDPMMFDDKRTMRWQNTPFLEELRARGLLRDTDPEAWPS